jgi:hypothetical protein
MLRSAQGASHDRFRRLVLLPAALPAAPRAIITPSRFDLAQCDSAAGVL